MLYAFIARDAPGMGAIRPIVRPRHLAYLQPLIDQGRVVFGGPHPAVDSPDPGPAGFTGSLIIADHGKGKFVYTGLVFFRELPAGVPGAYRLMANIIALNNKKSF